MSFSAPARLPSGADALAELKDRPVNKTKSSEKNFHARLRWRDIKTSSGAENIDLNETRNLFSKRATRKNFSPEQTTVSNNPLLGKALMV
jgi:hypothetical protein